jgi:23S rRNA pseudouridine2605 synthase
VKKKSKSLEEAPWVKRSKAESTAKPAKASRSPRPIEKKRNVTESEEKGVSSEDTPRRSRRQARTLDPRDAFNRKQKEARLQREKGLKEKTNPDQKPAEPLAKPAKKRETKKSTPSTPGRFSAQKIKSREEVPESNTKHTSRSSSHGEMRLNKFLAHSGIASRRAVDTLIMQGHVTINGQVVQEMGYKVKDGDIVTFKGKAVKPVDKLVYYLLNKPRNVITTASDERGRKTVMDIIAEKVPERIYPVGRLDRNTSGLLLLTNDGDLTKKLSHPSHKVPKVYLVTLDKNLALKDLEAIRSGITLEDGEIKADSLHYAEGGSKREVQIEIHSGRNRLVRRIFEHLGYEVVKLDRTYYAGLTKKNLPRGMFRPLTKEEVRMLKHFS